MLLCVVGAREDGLKELVGMELGYRESTESWAYVLARTEGEGAKCATSCDRGWGSWSVVGARRGLSDDWTPALLEPPLSERSGQVAEVDALVCEPEAAGDLPCSDPG